MILSIENPVRQKMRLMRMSKRMIEHPILRPSKYPFLSACRPQEKPIKNKVKIIPIKIKVSVPFVNNT